MKIARIKILGLFFLSAMAGAVLSWMVVGSLMSPQTTRIKKVVITHNDGNVKHVETVNVVRTDDDSVVVRISDTVSTTPTILDSAVTDEDDEAELPEEQRAVLVQLQEALDANDIKSVRRAVSRLMELRRASGAIARVALNAAVEALGWFGKDALPDLVSFACEKDEEVAASAIDKMMDALDDSALSDGERASWVKNLAKSLTDGDQIERVLSQLNNMRYSVRGETIKDILANGTPNVQAAMKDQIELYTDSDVPASQEGVDRWLLMNPDDPGDADLYGGDPGSGD